MFYYLYILKTVKRQFFVSLCVDILEECTEKRLVGGLSDLIRFLVTETVYVFLLLLFIFCLFLLTFYLRVLILYTTDFNPRINKDIILYYIQSNAPYR